MSRTNSDGVIRFGVFEADLRSGELRKSGVKIRLRDQAFQVLTELLERPGEVVTREELRNKLWPDGTFVDFDHSLNAAVNSIREVLGTRPRARSLSKRCGFPEFGRRSGGFTAVHAPAGRIIPRFVFFLAFLDSV